LGDWNEDVAAKNRQKLPHSIKKRLHNRAVALRQLRASCLVLVKRESASLRGFSEEPVFKISNMGFGEAFVPNEDDHRHPKLLCSMLLEALSNGLRLPDVGGRLIGLRIAPRQDVHARLAWLFRAKPWERK